MIGCGADRTGGGLSLVDDDANAVTQMIVELFPEETQRAHDRRAGHVDEGAVAFAPIEVDDLLELIEQGRLAFALLDALEYRGKHYRLHAAGRTLTAGFASEE